MVRRCDGIVCFRRCLCLRFKDVDDDDVTGLDDVRDDDGANGLVCAAFNWGRHAVSLKL